MKTLFASIRKSYQTCCYFYKLATKEKRVYPIIIIFNILISSFAPFINILVPKYVIDELMGEQNKRIILVYVLTIVVCNFLAAIIIRILQEIREMQEDMLSRNLELLMAEKAMKMKFEYTETEIALSARQKAETGMSWYSGGIKGMSHCVVKIGTSFCVIFGVIYIVVKVSPLLLLLSVLAVSVNSFCTSKINQASQEVFEKTPAINKFYSYIYTRITSREYAKELRLYNGSDLIEKKSIENADELNKMDNECARKQFTWGIPGSIISALSYGVSYCYLGIMALKGTISVSEFVMCITAIETFTNDCLLAIITNTQQLIMKSNFMNAFIEYMNLEDESYIGTKKLDIADFDGISFEHVSFRYPGSDQYILKDINIKIKRGERISIVGLNGAGKSTLVKLICRLYEVTEGAIKICGKNINEYSYEEYIKALSVVFQDFKLFGYSLDENIRLGKSDSKGESLDTIYEISGIADWVNELRKKGETLVCKDFDENGIELSGGQAQKVAIARAVYRDAPVVILDEPTAALDPVAEYEIYNKFNDLIRNKTAIYISHRLSSCKFCDKIIVISDKTIKEIGTHEELLKMQGIYAEMFRAQAQWYVEGWCQSAC
ncbi:MAG: ABC transporter ATP-binding protein [Lachnospiraceae bacterium]|nr:ABC transporter ATP-binding protein [Lachnospiraceae bacterium]